MILNILCYIVLFVYLFGVFYIGMQVIQETIRRKPEQLFLVTYWAIAIFLVAIWPLTMLFDIYMKCRES